MKTIAIDGPSGAGKSAIAGALAKRLGYEYIDTGALYRTIAYIAVNEGEDLTTEELLSRVDDQFIDYKDGSVLLNGVALGDVIRTEAISQKTSQLSKEPAVRDYLLSLQRRLAQGGGVVMEGRDIRKILPHGIGRRAGAQTLRTAPGLWRVRRSGKDQSRHPRSR